MKKKTLTIREEFDEPGMKANTIGRSEPNVFVGETEARGGDRVRLGEAREDRDVNELLLKRHQQCHSGHHQTSDAVE